MARRCDLTDIDVLSGNNVSHSNRKNKRRFLPNIQTVTLRSGILNSSMRMNLAARTIRSIDKNGGLDLFLINSKSSNLSEYANKLRRKIKKLKTENKAA